MSTPKKRYAFNSDNYLELDQFKEFIAEDQGCDPSEVSDDDAWRQSALQQEIDWEEELAQIKQFLGDSNLIYMGSRGLWDGARGCASIVSDFDEVLYRIQGRDYGDIDIYDENGELYVVFHHHDGSNIFAVRKITDAGEDFRMDQDVVDVDSDDVLAEIWDNDEYSEKVRLAEIVWGCPAEEWE